MPAPRKVLLLVREEAVRSLLADLIRDHGLAVLEDASTEPAAMVVAQVHRGGNVKGALMAAHLRAPRAPVLVVLPIPDERLSEEAARAGAVASYALGTPLAEFTRAIELAFHASAGSSR